VGQTFGVNVYNNTFAGLGAEQKLIRTTSFIGNKTDFGKFDNNRYIHSSSTNPFYKETKQIPENSKLKLSFNDWQEIGNQDFNSTAIMADSELLKEFAPEIIVNETMTEKEFKFEKDNYRDSKGQAFTGPVTLGAYQSVIVLKKKRN
jgi:hypothetical protein